MAGVLHGQSQIMCGSKSDSSLNMLRTLNFSRIQGNSALTAGNGLRRFDVALLILLRPRFPVLILQSA